MLTKDAFYIVYKSHEYIRRYLLEGGMVMNLDFPDHKWKFINGGKREKYSKKCYFGKQFFVYFVPGGDIS